MRLRTAGTIRISTGRIGTGMAACTADITDNGFKFRKFYAVNRIVRPAAFLTHDYQSAVSKDFHVVRKRRLSDRKRIKNLTCAQLAVRKHFDDSYTVFIPERLTYFCNFLFCHAILPC